MKTIIKYIAIVIICILLSFVVIHLRICKNGRTPLYYATLYATDHGNYALTDFLLKCGAPVNIHVNRHDDETFLSPAIRSKNIKLVKLLLQHGANANTKDSICGRTLLHTLAAVLSTGTDREYNINIAKLLLAHGAKVNLKDDLGDTPLHLAVGSANYPLSRLLLDHGADVNARDNEGLTPLFVCMLPDPKTKPSDNLQLMNLLLSRGASIHMRDGSDETLLHNAACSDHLEIVKKLLTMGMDCNSRDVEGETPLFFASDHPRMFDFLVQHGADVNALQDHSGDTLLHIVTKEHNINAMRILLKDGADPTRKNKDGYTPLMIASRYKSYPQIIDLLAERMKQ